MLAQALEVNKRSQRVLLAPYERAKGDYRALSGQVGRQAKRIRKLQQQITSLKKLVGTVSEQTHDVLYSDAAKDIGDEEKTRLVNAVNRTVKTVERIENDAKDISRTRETKLLAMAKKNLVGLGTQVLDLVVEQEQTTESWLKIQSHVDQSSVGSGVRGLPGRIAYSPFTVNAPPFDHLDARRAAFVNKNRS